MEWTTAKIVLAVVAAVGLLALDASGAVVGAAGRSAHPPTAKKLAKWSADGHIIYNPNNRTYCPETPETRPSNRVNTTQRIADLRAAMADTALVGGAPLNAYLVQISDDHGSEGSAWDQRLKYISGFSGSSGYAIITETETAVWTDGRYFLQADQQMDCNWIMMKQSTPGYPTGEEWLASILPVGSRVGAYPNYMSISVWQSYEAALAGKATLVGVPNDLVDVIWTDPDRPAKPNNPPFVHNITYAGVTWQDKATQVRQKLTEQPADALVVTVLEESAWLFNMRGLDQSFSKFYGYSIVEQDKLSFFLINHLQMIASIETQDHLQINPDGTCRTPGDGHCTNVYDYDDIINHIEQLAIANKSVWLDPTANYATYSAAGSRRLVVRSPIALMKGIKNDVERRMFAESIMRDSAALIEFLAFFEKEIAAGNSWTEVSAATRLEEIRSTYPGFKGVSFDTISGYGPHASVIHYRPDPSSPETNSQITTDNVYLLDSGGQYLDGTTDVTRTLHYGTPSAIVKEAYTRVLMGNIDLAVTVWPDGFYGSDLDARARAPIWQNGWDYNHGTGHGIGYYLSVHEGPGNINIGFSNNWTPIHEGMFFSDEPGFYEDNVYGIRLETLVQVVEADVPNHFGGKKFLGFKPVTMVPYEPNLINYSRLSETQINFLNYYNQRCLNEVGPYLLNVRQNQEAYDWLAARVVTRTYSSRAAGASSLLSGSCLLSLLFAASLALIRASSSA